MLRRMLTPTTTLIREFAANRRMLSGKVMLQYFMDNVLPSLLKFSNTDTEISYESTETIYMYKFNMFGGYPELMNFSSLHHLLLLESILWKRHQWYELFPGIHVCEIEGFYMVITRYRHIRNLQARVLFNRNLANNLDTYNGTYSSNEVNSMIRKHGELYHSDMVLDHVWLKSNFYYPRQIDIQIKSIMDLSIIQLTHNMIFKRLDTFVRRVTHPMQLDLPDILENGAYFSQWKKACNIFSRALCPANKGMAYLQSYHTKSHAYCITLCIIQ